jgi:hypothetical protein
MICQGDVEPAEIEQPIEEEKIRSSEEWAERSMTEKANGKIK